ncbi:thioredoxin domain-containing protein [Arcanobacterium phocisimile]|uniref:Thioredoxin domain-containing protein n=1 Tax=Arcanobacterium phocisimile TaxID=1302235 RepID=A0ABX7IGD4_9ACTO|nr:thioredoxin domain-containing protein [Arcanobacterium phocisimile]QRV02027.1 thioredoxin domain-containing protein [Arcanobacterium phocisimile]
MTPKNTPGLSQERMTKEERRQVAREKARMLKELEVKQAKRRKMITLAVSVVSLLLVVFAVWQIVTSDKGDAKQLGSYTGTSREVLTDHVAADGGVLFDQNLVATSEESGTSIVGLWSDYMCPACEVFDTKYVPQMEEYGTAGELQLSMHVVNTLGTDFSTKGAAAFYYLAQYAPEKVWEFNHAMMERGQQIHAQSVPANQTAADIADIAKSVGVAEEVVNDLPASILDSKWQDVVAKTVSTFRDNGFTGTPTLTVDGQADDSWTKGNPDEVIPEILKKAAGK